MAQIDCNMEFVRHILTWFNWILLALLGGYLAYSLITNSFTSHRVANVLAVYLSVFGAIGLLFEARVKVVYDNINFLHTKIGRGAFFIFVGTLAISMQGAQDQSSDKVISWVLGGCSCFVGIFNILTVFLYHEANVDEQAPIRAAARSALESEHAPKI